MGGKKEQGWRWHIRGKGDVTDDWAPAPGNPARERQRQQREQAEEQASLERFRRWKQQGDDSEGDD